MANGSFFACFRWSSDGVHSLLLEHTIDGTPDLVTAAAGQVFSIATPCLCAGAFPGFCQLIQQQVGFAARD